MSDTLEKNFRACSKELLLERGVGCVIQSEVANTFVVSFLENTDLSTSGILEAAFWLSSFWSVVRVAKEGINSPTTATEERVRTGKLLTTEAGEMEEEEDDMRSKNAKIL